MFFTVAKNCVPFWSNFDNRISNDSFNTKLCDITIGFNMSHIFKYLQRDKELGQGTSSDGWGSYGVSFQRILMPKG